jgi:hypothetical protein
MSFSDTSVSKQYDTALYTLHELVADISPPEYVNLAEHWTPLHLRAPLSLPHAVLSAEE